MARSHLSVDRVAAAEETVRFQIGAINCWLCAERRDTGALIQLVRALEISADDLAREQAGVVVRQAARPKPPEEPSRPGDWPSGPVGGPA